MRNASQAKGHVSLGHVQTEQWVPISFKKKANSAFKKNKVYYICPHVSDLLVNTGVCKSVVHIHQF